MNTLSLAWSFIISPTPALRQLREKPTFLFPLLLIVLSSAALMFWYYAMVDMDWLKDYLYSGNARIKALAEADRVRVMAALSRTAITVSAVIAVVIITPLMFLLQALFFWVAGLITGARMRFKQWFALACWSQIPTLVAVVYGAVLLATSGHAPQLSPGALQPLSLNELFYHRGPDEVGYALLNFLNLLNFWVWALCVLGVRLWTGRSWLFSILFVMLPIAVLIGGGAFLTFRNA